MVLSRKSRFLPLYEPLANLNLQVTLGQDSQRRDGSPSSLSTASPIESRPHSPRTLMSPPFRSAFRRRSGNGDTGSSDEYCSEGESGSPTRVRRGASSALSDATETRRCMLTRLESIDAARMRCTATVKDPAGCDQVLRIRFANPDAMEEWLASSPVALPHRHHRCSCCLEWVYADGVRCTTCQQPLHQACAEKWLHKKPWCPNCRAEWKLKRSSMTLGMEDFLKGT